MRAAKRVGTMPMHYHFEISVRNPIVMTQKSFAVAHGACTVFTRNYSLCFDFHDISVAILSIYRYIVYYIIQIRLFLRVLD